MEARDGSPGARGRSGLIELAVSKPVAITMIVAAATVFGLVSLGKLPVDLLPEISYPTITVRTTWRGAAPEDVEDRVSERVQEALSTLPHLVRTSSVSRAETSDVVLDFDWGTPMTFAVQDVRDKLDGVFLPDGCDKPLILRYDPNLDPILRLAISLPETSKMRTAALDPETSLAAERELVHLRWLAENRVKRELEPISGVAAVQVRGGLVEEIRVRVDPFKMAAQGLDPKLVSERLAQENLNASGGLIREGSTEYLVRTLNEFHDVEEIADLALVRRNGATVRVRDIASVTRTHAEREVVTRLDGAEAVEIAIYREAGANIVDVVESVRERVFGTESEQAAAKRMAENSGGGAATWQDRESASHLAFSLRKDARFEVLSDQSTFIRDSIEDVKSAAVQGVLLTVLVIWLALRRGLPTLIISISIPVSVIATFSLMYAFDVSLNIMSLGGLALGIGIVVDASIVVVESITSCREDGDGPIQAAVRGTREVLTSVNGSTLTNIAVFAPIVFVSGIAGRVFGDQALTVVGSLAVSLLAATFFIPMLSSRRFFERRAAQEAAAPVDTAGSVEAGAIAGAATVAAGVGAAGVSAASAATSAKPRGLFGRIAHGIGWLLWRAFEIVVRVLGGLFALVTKLVGWVLWPLGWLHDRMWNPIERVYPRVLGAALRHPWIVLLLAGGVSAFAASRAGVLGLDLLPEIHQGEFTAHVALDVGSPLPATDAVMRDIEARARAIEGVAMTALVVGVEKDTLTREIEGKHTSRLTVRLKPGLANARDEERVLERVRETIAHHPAVRRVDFTRPTPFALDAPVQVEVLGYDLAKLRTIGAEVADRLAKVDGLEDVRSSVRPGHPEARVTFDRDKTLEFGLDLEAASKLVRDQVLGNVSTRFNEGDDRIDVRVLGDEIVLDDLDRVLDLVVNPGSAAPVALRDVARVETVEGPAEIRRIGNTRAVVVTAAQTGLDLGGAGAKIERALSTLPVPDDVVVQIGGQKRDLDEARRSLQFALLFALFLVYAVMAAQFESFVQPLIILVTVPLAGVGVVFALDALDMPVSVVVFIGLILLAGIVVANAIVLIDRINLTRARGLSVRESVLDAGTTRLRPIYMTTMTTLIGLVPMTGWFASVPLLAGLSSGAGAELRAPMAITVIAGLAFSTMLTLLVIPSVYWLLNRRADARRTA